MTLFLLSLALIGVAMAGLALNILAGRATELRRGCTAQCPCAKAGRSPGRHCPVNRKRQEGRA
jgi:hypothetical protein